MIGIFDSGLGGLTVHHAIAQMLPDVDLVYLADHAHAPYGDRDHEEIYALTLAGTRTLLSLGCPLVIIACNTASAQALRRIQQEHLPSEFPTARVLGVIRPSVEILAQASQTKHVGVVGTRATVAAGAYTREFRNLDRAICITEVACPELAPLVEAGVTDGEEIASVTARASLDLLTADPIIDTVLLGCTHFQFLARAFQQALPPDVAVIVQGPIVAEKLLAYLERHQEIATRLTRTGERRYLTTGDPAVTSHRASALLRRPTVFERAPGRDENA